MVKAGLYSERALFQRLNQGTVDAYGNVATNWPDYGNTFTQAAGLFTEREGNFTGNPWSDIETRSAQVLERTGKEAIEQGALTDTNMARLRVRSDSTTRAITSADRVYVRGITWAIKNVIQLDSKNTILEFTIERGVAP